MKAFDIAMHLPRGPQGAPEAVRTSFQRIAEDLQRSHIGLKEFVEASEKAAREACDHILFLQGQLEEELRYRAMVVTMLTNVAGVEEGILGQVDLKERECRVTRLSLGRERGKEHSLNSNPAQHYLSNPPFHIFSSKRNHDDLNESDEDTWYGYKRPRLGKYTPQTILDYTSNGTTYNTYSDSNGTDNGTESDLVDDHYSFYDYRGHPPRVELCSQSSSGEESHSDIDSSPKSVRWSSISDFKDSDDSSDSDYQPPDWDMEDIWELEATHKSPKHPLYRFAYDKELRQCEGVMSDASLSTDDPDAGYNETGKLSFASTRWFDFSLSLGPLLERLPWDQVADYRPAHRHSYDLIPPPREEAIARYRLSLWDNIRDMTEDGKFESVSSVDFEQRLHDLLASDHLQFYFDDKEWMKFGPLPVSSRQPEPRSPKVLSLLEERWLLFLGPDSE